MRNNIACTTNSKCRTAATLCTLENIVDFRYIILNSLHKNVNKQ
jgi:hypothetical protein